MSDFETALRSQLRAAAEQAPPFSRALLEAHGARHPAPADRPGRHTPTRGPRRRWLAAAAAAAIVVTSGAWWVTGRDSGSSPEASSCPTEAVADGQVYVANGDLTRMPKPGPRAGLHVLAMPCGAAGNSKDGTPVAAFRIPGVNPTVGFLADGKVWTNARFRALPVALRDLYAAVRCTGAGPRTLTGTLIGSDARVTTDYNPALPYTATFQADAGPGLRLDRYSSVTVRLRVTAQTRNGADPRFLRRALGHAEPVRVEVTCVGGRFFAIDFASQ